MNTFFIDSYFFIALLNRRDKYHLQASQLIDVISGPTITTDFVLIELADGLANPEHRGKVSRLIHAVRSKPSCEIIPATSQLIDAGLDLYGNRPDKAWSLTDCISFTVMENKGIKAALTGDKHFEQAGFTAMLK